MIYKTPAQPIRFLTVLIPAVMAGPDRGETKAKIRFLRYQFLLIPAVQTGPDRVDVK